MTLLPTCLTQVSHSISKLRALIIKIRASPQRREKYHRQREAEKLQKRELLIDVRTRWNSTHDMLLRAIEMRKALQNVALGDTDLPLLVLSTTEWTNISTICLVLSHFKKTTDWICKSSIPTLSTAVPAYNYLIDKIELYQSNLKDQLPFPEALTAAKEKLCFYYEKTGAIAYPVATILDPRLKMHYYKNNNWEEHWIKEAKEAIVTEFNYYHTRFAPSHSLTQNLEEEEEKVQEEDDEELEESDNDMSSEIFKDSDEIPKSELENYLDSPKVARDTDILGW